MTLIAQVAQLRELERQMTTIPWRAEPSGEGHEIRMADAIENRARYQSQRVIDYDHGCWDNEDQEAEAESNAIGIIALRNAAPALLEVLGAFQEGDTHLMQGMQVLLEKFDEILTFPNDEVDAAKQMLVRLAEAARQMEAREEQR